MSEQVGKAVLQVLEQAGERWLAPEVYRIFLFQIEGTRTVRRYEASKTYWDQIQRILDCFFCASERAEICTRLLERDDLQARPEFQGFLAQALAERRLQEYLQRPELTRAAPAR
jgi:hypothetical protein